MAMLKLSNWSTRHYIGSDLGPSGAKCVVICEVSLFKMSVYQKDCVWQKMEKSSGQEINVVISDMSLYPKFNVPWL